MFRLIKDTCGETPRSATFTHRGVQAGQPAVTEHKLEVCHVTARDACFKVNVLTVLVGYHSLFLP